MTSAEVAATLAISPNAVLRGLCGTSVLTRIRPGGSKRLLFVRDEVNRLADEWISSATEQRERASDFLKHRRERGWNKA
jgi:hypothetical protein